MKVRLSFILAVLMCFTLPGLSQDEPDLPAGGATVGSPSAQRSSGGSIAISSLDANSAGLSVTESGPKINYLFYIHNTTSEEIDDLYIRVLPFSGPSDSLLQGRLRLVGEKIEEGTQLGPLTLGPKTRGWMELRAEIMNPGTYITGLVVEYNGKSVQETKTLIVKRENQGEAGFEIKGVADITGVSWGIFGSTVNFPILLQAKQSAQFVHPPVLYNLVRQDNDNTISIGNYKTEFMEEDGTPITEPILLRPNEPRPVHVKISGLTRAGKYTATIAASPDVAAPIEKEITIKLRHGFLLAALTIALGILVSWILRRYLNERKPRLLQRQDVARLNEELIDLKARVGEVNEEEEEVFALLTGQLADLDTKIQTKGAPEANDVLASVNAKIPAIGPWINARKEVDKLEPAEKLRPPLRAKLNSVGEFLKNRSVAPAANMRTLFDTTVPTDWNAEINTVVKAHLVDEIASWETELQKAGVPAAFNDKDEDKANWVSMKSDLQSQLMEIKQMPNARKAMNMYNGAYEKYIRGMSMQWLKRINDPETSATDEEDDFSRSIKSATLSLDNALEQLQKGNMKVAAELYEKADKELTELTRDPATAEEDSGAKGIFDKDSKVGAILSGFIPGLASAPEEKAGMKTSKIKPIADYAAISKEISRNDLIITLAAGTLAMLLGIKLLWANSGVWGGFTDYLTALLWGLGFDQAGVATGKGMGMTDIQGLFGQDKKGLLDLSGGGGSAVRREAPSPEGDGPDI